jgi:iron(III) transport system permease protein
VLGWLGYAALPWYRLERDLLEELVAGSGLLHGLTGTWWLLPIALPLLAALRPLAKPDERAGAWLAAAGGAGLALVIVQGFAIGLNGWRIDVLAAVLRTKVVLAG